LADLTTAVGVGEANLAAANAKDALSAAGDNAASLWDKFTRKVGEMTDAAGQRVDHEQTKRRLDEIEDPVGRPVTKVMLDLEDRVILDLGDLITHAAVQRAHDAGALDSLLASVFKGDVAFERNEMRAEKRGEAALEAAQKEGLRIPRADVPDDPAHLEPPRSRRGPRDLGSRDRLAELALDEGGNGTTEVLGRLDGFLVDSARRCLRYFVIRRLGPQSLIMARVPFVPARLDSEHGVLRLLDDATAQTLA
jgi:hypothetical protein